MTGRTGLYDWLFLVHVLAGMIWLGGVVTVGLLATRILREREPGAVAGFLGSLRVIGPRVFAPSTAVLLGVGIWMVLDSEAWSFSQGWIQIALGLIAAAFLIGAVNQSRTALAAERASEEGDEAEALRQLRRWAVGMAVIILMLVAATWDMVFKPGL